MELSTLQVYNISHFFFLLQAQSHMKNSGGEKNLLFFFFYLGEDGWRGSEGEGWQHSKLQKVK
jgi:hypothetical protein